MLFVLFEFAWKREVSAIINLAKIGMILRLPELPESNQMVRGTFYTDSGCSSVGSRNILCSISSLDVLLLIPTHGIPGFR